VDAETNEFTSVEFRRRAFRDAVRCSVLREQSSTPEA
jgi:hypothetical protein